MIHTVAQSRDRRERPPRRHRCLGPRPSHQGPAGRQQPQRRLHQVRRLWPLSPGEQPVRMMHFCGSHWPPSHFLAVTNFMWSMQDPIVSLPQFTDLGGWGPLLASVGTVALALLAALALHKLGLSIACRLAARTETIVDGFIIKRTASPTRWLLITLALLTIMPALALGDDVKTMLGRILVLIQTGIVGWLFVSAIGVLKDYVETRYDIAVKDNLRARQMRTRTGILYRIAVAVVAIVTACLMLMSFPSIRHIGLTLFASAGLAGLAIGAAAQPTLKNLIAGVQLAFTEPIRLDDVVIIDGEWGRIEEIRTTYVVVRLWDERRLIVPVSRFLEQPFQNWTRRTADLLGTAYFYMDYSVPVERVRAQLTAIVKSSPLWDGKVCVLQVTDLKEHTIELRALVSAADSGDAFELRCHVREEMIKFIHDHFPAALPKFRAEVLGSGDDDRPGGSRRTSLQAASAADGQKSGLT